MPNNDLGTAHGRIRIDYDNRGQAAATAALIKMQKQFAQMNNTLIRIEKSLSQTEAVVEDSAKSFDKAAKSTKNFSSSMFNAHKSVSTFARDAKQLANDLNTLQRIIFLLDARGRTLANFGKRMNVFGSSLRGGSNAILSFNRALKETGVYTNFWRKNMYRTINVLAGTKKAMAEMPAWTRSLYSFAGSLAKVGAIGLAVGKMLDAGFIKKFTGTGLFSKIVNGAKESGNALDRLNKRIEQIFGSKGKPFLLFDNITSGIRKSLKDAEKGLTDFTHNTSNRLSFMSRTFNKSFQPIANLSKNLRGFVLGAALITSGIGEIIDKFKWLGKIPKPILMGLGVTISTILPAAFQVLGKSLSFTSNLLVGLLDGIKQLSGGLIALPGLISVIGTTVTSLIPVFAGLKDAFKDVFSDDPMKAWEAYYKLPEHLRPIADAILKFVPKWKELQKTLQTNAFKGFDKQIEQLGNTYFSIVAVGAGKVIAAVRNAKDELVKFALTQQTQADANHIYSNTATIMNNIAQAVKPALEGLRDMAFVGSDFLRDSSSWAPALSKRFKEWAATNRKNGNFMKWMQDARSGARDLIKGLTDLTKGLWTILTIFKTNRGNNFLDNFAKSMEKFNQAVNKSAAVGFLHNLGTSVRELGKDKISEFMDIFRSFLSMMEEFGPVIQTISQAFSGVFVPALKWAMAEIKIASSLIHSLGFDQFTGFVLGWAAAFKLLPSVLKPTYEALKILGGVFLILQNKNKIISALETGFLALGTKMSKIPFLGNKVSDAFVNMSTGASKTINSISSLGKFLTKTAAAILVFWSAIENGNSKSRDLDNQLSQNSKSLNDFRDSLNKAFIDDKGVQGTNVMDSIKDGVNSMVNDAQSAADKMPGVMDHLLGFFDFTKEHDEQFTWNPLKGVGDPKDVNRLQEMGTQGKLAVEGFKNLADAGYDLTNILSSSDSDFKQSISNMRASGDTGNAAADVLQKYRDKLDRASAAARAAGPNQIALTKSVQELAEAGDDVVTRFEKVREILTELGIIKPDAIQAAIDYSNALRDTSNSIKEVMESGASLDDLLKGNTFNTDTEAGAKFAQSMLDLATAFDRDLKSGHNLDVAWDQLQNGLKDIAAIMNIPIEKLQELITQAGAVKQVGDIKIDVLSNFAGDAIAQAFLKTYLQSKQDLETGIKIPVIISNLGEGDAKKVADEINKILPGYAEVDPTGNLVIKPIEDQSAFDAVKRKLEELGKPINPSVAPVIAPPPTEPTTRPPGTVPRNPGAGQGRIFGGGGGRAFGNGSQAQQDYLDSVAVPLDAAAQAAQDGGVAFTEDFADGILAQKSKVERAADEVAKAAADRMPGSPAKKGPLSGSGWSRVSGKSFSTDFAAGITSGAGAVGTASSGIASIAGGNIQNDKSYQAGKFLGQASTLVDFAQHAVDAFSKLTETIIGAAKFMSDPLGKGTFFGKSRAWRRDPGISDEALARQRQLARQQRVSSSLASPQYPNSTIDSYGLPIVSGPVNRESSKADLQRAIAAEGQRVGAKPEDIAAAFAIAQQESGYNPIIVGAGKGGGGADAIGLFQQTLGMWGTMQELTDPNIAIQKYWEHWLQNSGITDPLERAVAVQGPASPTNGGYSASTLAPKYAESVKDLQSIFQSGGISQTTEGTLPIPALGQIAPPSILHDSSGYGSKQAAQTSAAVIARLFPQIGNIGGARPDALPYHSGGRAIDIMIPGGTTGNGANPSGKALGDQIRDFFLANADQLGVEDTIWQDFWQPPGAAGRPMNSGGSDTNRHLDHVHITFRDGAIADIGPNGSKLRMPTALGPGIPRALATVLPSSAFGPPSAPNDPNEAPRTQVVRNPDGTFSPVHDGSGAVPGEKLNPLTTQPWTPQEKADYWNRPENQPRFDIAQNDLNDPNIVYQTQQEMAGQLEDQTGLLNQIYTNGVEGLTTQQAIAANTQLQANIDRLKSTGNTADQVTADYLSGIQGDIAENYGLSQEENPFDVAANIAGAASSIAGSIFSVVDSAFGAINGAKDLTDTLLRGVENTEDLYKMVDQIQTFITLAGDIAGAVSDVTGAISGIVGAAGGAAGGADMGGTSGAAAILGAISTISGLVQSGIDTVNAIIDLGQEAYRIIGSYFGQYLGMVVGGPDGALMGNVKFLLDQQSGQLLAYSQDNPLDKRAHNLAFQTANPNARGQLIGNVNVYGGPGSDPRDNTRQMMWQVKTSTMTQAVGQ